MNCARCRLPNPEGSNYCSHCGSPLAAPRPSEGERKLVTVLFADVVGSTMMGETLDPEQITEIMNGAFTRFNTEISRYGGTVSRLMGDAVLAIFGAPTAHEDDAERAILAALAIQVSAEEYASEVLSEYDVEFRVRVGINTGLGVLSIVGDGHGSEYTVMGDAANVAARMQTAARTGAVLISADTYHFVKGMFEFTPRGPMAVKGKNAPIETYEVVSAKAGTRRVRGIEGLHSPLVGRDGEMREGRAAVQAALEGRGSFVTVTGEAGLGKSRIVSELRASVREMTPTPTWLEGQCVSYGQALMYHPWRHVIRQSLGVTETDPPQTVAEHLGRAWADLHLSREDLTFVHALLGLETEATTTALAELQRARVAANIGEAVRRYIAALAEGGPVVVALDDLHWADEASLDTLTAISTLVQVRQLVIVAILRPDRSTPGWRAVEHIRASLDGTYHSINLEPLSDRSSQSLLGNLLFIDDLPAQIRSLMLRKSEGNPFFLEEVIRTLIDSGHVVFEDGHWRATRDIVDVAIPDTLLGLLTARIDRLPESTKRVAQTAAVIGRIFARPVLSAVLSQPEGTEPIDDPDPHLHTLIAEELVRERARDPDREYIFKHVLTQEAAYDLLLIRTRREYHRAVGHVLEDLYPQRSGELAPILSRHFWLGEDWPSAARYAAQAGAEAESAGALREATDQYDRVYRSLKQMSGEQPTSLIDAILSWVRTGYKLEPSDRVLERLAEAESLARAEGDKRRLALTLNWIGNQYCSMGVPSGGVPAMVEGYGLAEELGSVDLVLGWTFLISESLVDKSPREALPHMQRIIDTARKCHYEDIEAHALAMKAMTHARLGEFTDAELALHDALELGRIIHSPVKLADIHSAASLMYYDMGDTERGLEYSRLAADGAFHVGGYECGVFGMYSEGMGHLHGADWSRASESFEEAATRATSSKIGSEWLSNRIRAGLAMARARLGNPGALQELEEILPTTRAFDDDYTAALISHQLGEMYTGAGDLDRADGHLRDALDYYRRNDMRPYLPRILRSVADLRVRQNRDGEAAEARAQADRIATESVLQITKSSGQVDPAAIS